MPIMNAATLSPPWISPVESRGLSNILIKMYYMRPKQLYKISLELPLIKLVRLAPVWSSRPTWLHKYFNYFRILSMSTKYQFIRKRLL